MTCKDCIHSGLCYKENDYENFPEKCGSFIPERPTGEWIYGEEETGAFGIVYINKKCSRCSWEHSLLIPNNYCPNCGADMRGDKK